MIKKFLDKVKSTDGKILLENFLSLSALQIIGMLLPLITLPYVLRVIGFEKYGIIVISAALVTYFTSLTDFSFKITAVRDVAVFKHSKVRLNYIYSKVVTIKLLFLLFSWTIISLIVYFYSPFFENRLIHFYSSLMLLGYVLFPEWFFQGIEKMRYITYLNLGVKLFFTICIFIFIKNEEDYWIYPLLNSLGFIGAGLIGQYILIKRYRLKFVWLPVKIILRTVRDNFPIFVNQFLPTLYNNTSTFLLGIFSSDKLVGIYQAILTLVNLGVSLIEIISRVFFPFLNRKKEAFTSFKKLMVITVSIIVLGLLSFNRIIFWYLGLDYEYAFQILIILALGLFGYMLYNIYGLNYFIVHRQDKLVMKNTIISSIIGLILAFPLIHFFGIIGAALNLTISRGFMGGSLFVKYLLRNRC